ncbi:hypothetical protein BKA70DRAFT_1449311 [Coprinopsis sp. MPI-PUGE-AT-0042]|nr:hypothetical protein BKA70DRAFT_1449311 [Coprinopsis sp. MPI-PUGE-AT-0042]
MHARAFASMISPFSACTALARPVASPQPQDGGIKAAVQQAAQALESGQQQDEVTTSPNGEVSQAIKALESGPLGMSHFAYCNLLDVVFGRDSHPIAAFAAADQLEGLDLRAAGRSPQ